MTPRYILIERNSGYIWGDSADLDGKAFTGTALEYAAALEASIGEVDIDDVQYYETYKSDETACYDVYRADLESFPIIRDGQDQETIKAVINNCDYVTTIGRQIESKEDETI